MNKAAVDMGTASPTACLSTNTLNNDFEGF